MVGDITRGNEAKNRSKSGGTVKVMAKELREEFGKTQVSFTVKADITKSSSSCFLTLNRKLPKGDFKPVYKTEGKLREGDKTSWN